MAKKRNISITLSLSNLAYLATLSGSRSGTIDNILTKLRQKQTRKRVETILESTGRKTAL